MIMQIEGVLTPEAVALLRAALAVEDQSFQPGTATAGWHARQVKNNEQSEGPAAQAAMAEVEMALMANKVFTTAARPKQLLSMRVARYRAGMEYGLHVDDAVMQGVRTDLSFTVFLSAPEAYEGGELVIEGNDAKSVIKLKAGSAVVYPTTSLHRVARVTSGERLVVVGWVRSLVRRADQREVLFDLDTLVADLRQQEGPRSRLDRLTQIKANLLRMWVED